jgi:PKD repeat protein
VTHKSTVALVIYCFFLSFSIASQAAIHNVTIGDNFFSSNDLTINVGDTVQWTYSGGRMHDVTADDFSWNSPTSSSIDYQQTFNSIEEVLYHCTVHSTPGQNINTRMNGRINVIQADENQAPTAGFNFNCADLDCSFMDQSSDSDGTISSWSWNFDDGGSSSAQNPNHNFATAGTYSVSLAVTDDDGAGNSISRSVTVSEPAPDPILINIGMMDAWSNPLTDGQGMLIIVWENIEFMFMAWFTFDTERPPEDVMAILGEPGHRWLTASGPYTGDTATLDVFLTSGGVFDSAEPPAITDQEPIGTVTIKWTGCNAAVATYNIPSLGLMGDIPIERIVLSNVPLCEAGQ